MLPLAMGQTDSNVFLAHLNIEFLSYAVSIILLFVLFWGKIISTVEVA
jgi:hypothetical protein